MAISGPVVAISATGQALAMGPPGPQGAQGAQGPSGPPGASGAAASQATTALANGLNSNVAIGAITSVRFGSYTGAVILGGLSPSTPPTAGQTFDLSFTVAQQVTIRNLDASSTATNQIVTGTGGDVLLPAGQTPSCRLVFDGTIQKYVLQTTGVHQDTVLNVLNFGLVGDGVTANDAAIVNLFAYIAGVGSAGELTVYFPPGTYLFNNPVTNTPVNVKFQGAGFGSASTLAYGGIDSFWWTTSFQTYEHLRFIPTRSDSYSANPAQQNLITGASSGPSTTTSGSNTLQSTTLTVASTSGFGSSGTAGVVSSLFAPYRASPFTYTGTTSTTFNGCDFGTLSTGASVVCSSNANFSTTITAGSNGQMLPSVLDVVSTTGFNGGSFGSLLVQTSVGMLLCSYTGVTATAFTGVSWGTIATGATVAEPIVVTTATAHGYVAGDQLGIYAAQYPAPPSPILNCDPSQLWTVASPITATTFTLFQSIAVETFSAGTTTSPGSSAVSSVTVSGSSLTVTTSSAHGLHNGQLVYLSGLSGLTPASGLGRVSVVNATAFSVSITATGTYTSGGHVATGGVCVSYSHIALIGLNMQLDTSVNNGVVHVKNCNFGNWKYGISVDGYESSDITGCQFGGGGVGYLASCFNNDSTHSAFGIRIGGFRTSQYLQFANGIYVDTCVFYNAYAGIYHHDGITHTVERCNWEIGVLAMIGPYSEGIHYSSCTNDGSVDSLGLFIFKSDAVADGSAYSCSFENMYVAGSASMVSVDPSCQVIGLTIRGGQFNGGSSSYLVDTSITWSNDYASVLSPVVIEGIYTGSSKLTAIAAQSIGVGVGTPINHYLAPTAALDINFSPNQTTSPGLYLRDVTNGGRYYHAKVWTPQAGAAPEGGSSEEWTDLISTQLGVTGSRSSSGTGWVYVAPGSSAVSIGKVTIPTSFHTGVIIATIFAVNASLTNSYWRIKQRFYVYGGYGASFINILDEYEVLDGYGLTPPTLQISSAVAETPPYFVSALVSSSSSLPASYSVQFELETGSP